jgi:hypothetical protein
MKLSTLSVVLLILCSAVCLMDQNADTPPPGQAKVWRFPVRDGELVITLFVSPDADGKRNSISITTAGVAASPTVDDEAADLHKVLDEMQSLGYSLTAIRSIHMGVLDDQTLKSLQLAAANSKTWRECIHAKSCNGQSTILRLLIEIGAYNKIVQVLNLHGLKAKLSYLEDLLAKPCPDPRNQSNGTNGSLILPIDALLEFSLSPE